MLELGLAIDAQLLHRVSEAERVKALVADHGAVAHDRLAREDEERRHLLAGRILRAATRDGLRAVLGLEVGAERVGAHLGLGVCDLLIFRDLHAQRRARRRRALGRGPREAAVERRGRREGGGGCDERAGGDEHGCLAEHAVSAVPV